MGDPAVNRYEHFTYRQYLTWPDEERWELIDGIAWSMSAAPTSRHQEILGKLHVRFAAFLKGKTCKVFLAPFDVLLPKGDEEDGDVDTVVQPDLSVFCDRSKITKPGARGAPDLLIEILSPSTTKKDINDKFDRYERAGVREYWLVDPGNRSIWLYRRNQEGKFDEGELREPFRDFSAIASSVLEGLSIDPEELFSED